MQFNVEAMLASLPYMLKGMIGIFAVVFVIMLCTWLLGKFTEQKK